jgi:hypothetical protein
MDLKDFVAATLIEVVEGIKEAQSGDHGQNVSPSMVGNHTFPGDSGLVSNARVTSTIVKFDVAVTAESSDAAKGSSGIKIAVLNIGVEGAVSTKNTSVSRIQFSVPIVLPHRRP